LVEDLLDPAILFQAFTVDSSIVLTGIYNYVFKTEDSFEEFCRLTGQVEKK
jgi:hypothetical protein